MMIMKKEQRLEIILKILIYEFNVLLSKEDSYSSLLFEKYASFSKAKYIKLSMLPRISKKGIDSSFKIVNARILLISGDKCKYNYYIIL
jgi:hypothetical protein